VAKVVVYTKDYCPYCVAAKTLLQQRGIPYEEIKLSTDSDDFAQLQKKSGMRTVPQIFHGDRLIGGFDALTKLDQETALAQLKD
jgi:glutaredoxin 3